MGVAMGDDVIKISHGWWLMTWKIFYGCRKIKTIWAAISELFPAWTEAGNVHTPLRLCDSGRRYQLCLRIYMLWLLHRCIIQWKRQNWIWSLAQLLFNYLISSKWLNYFVLQIPHVQNWGTTYSMKL
jgi:hypothetical protein